jgi:hypothetical protein
MVAALSEEAIVRGGGREVDSMLAVSRETTG